MSNQKQSTMIEFYQSPKDAKYYWRAKAPNGEIVAQGQGYQTEDGLKKGIKAVTRIFTELAKDPQLKRIDYPH